MFRVTLCFNDPVMDTRFTYTKNDELPKNFHFQPWHIKWMFMSSLIATIMIYVIASLSYKLALGLLPPSKIQSLELPSSYWTDMLAYAHFTTEIGNRALKDIYHYKKTKNKTEQLVTLRWERISQDKKYRYYDRALIGDTYVDVSLKYKTCLATQASIDRIYSLTEMIKHWNGPISVAVFIYGKDDYNFFLDYITLLKKCYPNILDKILFSFMLPNEKLHFSRNFTSTRYSELPCFKSKDILEKLLSPKNKELITRDPYPQNHMRNLALHNCLSEYEFLIDIDIIPSEGIAEQLNLFLPSMENCKKCVFVIPTYEIHLKAPMPKNKKALLLMKEKGLAQPFHQKVFIYNQKATNFSEWENVLDMYSRKIRILHSISEFSLFYEPFYVSRTAVPPFDERFIGYGFTRISQAYEMHLAGYIFNILSPIFACHRGLKKLHNWPDWRKDQNDANRIKFESFKKMLSHKYNITNDRNATELNNT